MDEEQLLLDKLGRSDVNALDTLYVRYAPKVYDFALRFLKNEAEAEDVTQDIFLQVWDNRSLMGQVVSIRAYLSVPDDAQCDLQPVQALQNAPAIHSAVRNP